MALVDILIIVFIIGSLWRGIELGFVRQLLSTVGFFGGLIIGALLEPHTIIYAHTPQARIGITLLTTLGMAFLVLGICELIGLRLKQRLLFSAGLNYVDNGFGALLAIASTLVLIWLSTAALAALPYPGIRQLLLPSKIVSYLDRTLPPAPTL